MNGNLKIDEKSRESLSTKCKEDVPDGASYWQTLTNMIKGNVGCGMLGMGIAFKHGGLMASTTLVYVLLFISCYNQHILVKIANKLTNKIGTERVVSFADTIGFAFENGSQFGQKLKMFIKIAVNFSILTTQLGCCCIYLTFITQGIQQISCCYNEYIEQYKALLIILPLILLTSMIRNLKFIVPLSIIANISLFTAVMLILFCATTDLKPIEERKFFGNWEELSLCFGGVVFAIEGITMILPLQQTMKYKKGFTATFGVLNVSIVCLLIILWTLGFFGYWKYGEDVQENLIQNLPIKDHKIAQMVVVALTIGILFTYTLQFHVGVCTLMPLMEKYISSLPFLIHYFYEYIFRVILVLFIFFFTAMIPHLDSFISLVGAVGSTSLSFIYAPLGHIMISGKENNGKIQWTTITILDAISIIIGLTGLIMGMGSSISRILIPNNSTLVSSCEEVHF